MTRDDSFIYAYNGEDLVGAFDLGIINFIYLTEKNSPKKPENDKGSAMRRDDNGKAD